MIDIRKGLLIIRFKYNELLKTYGVLLLLVGIFILVTIFSLFQLIQWHNAASALSNKDRIDAEATALQTIAQIFGASFFLFTAYFTWRSARSTDRTIAISLESQLTERFSKAIEHLSEQGNLTKQLGGIYTLEHIAIESDKYHQPILDVLSAYIRARTRNRELLPDSTGPNPLPEVDAIVSVLIRLSKPDERRLIDLSGCDLRGISISEANLGAFAFTGTDFRGARLFRCYFRNADLAGTNFEGASVYNCRFSGSDLMGSSFKNAELMGAFFSGMYLVDVNMEGVNLSAVHLENVSLINVNLKNVKYQNAYLNGTKFKHITGLTEEQIQEARATSRDKE